MKISPGGIDAHEPMQRRHDQIDHQIGDEPPVDLVETLQVGIAADRIDHVRGRKMVDVIRQRRQRLGDDRDRRQRDQHQCTGARATSPGCRRRGAVAERFGRRDEHAASGKRNRPPEPSCPFLSIDDIS